MILPLPNKKEKPHGHTHKKKMEPILQSLDSRTLSFVSRWFIRESEFQCIYLHLMLYGFDLFTIGEPLSIVNSSQVRTRKQPLCMLGGSDHVHLTLPGPSKWQELHVLDHPFWLLSIYLVLHSYASPMEPCTLLHSAL